MNLASQLTTFALDLLFTLLLISHLRINSPLSLSLSHLNSPSLSFSSSLSFLLFNILHSLVAFLVLFPRILFALIRYLSLTFHAPQFFMPFASYFRPGLTYVSTRAIPSLVPSFSPSPLSPCRPFILGSPAENECRGITIRLRSPSSLTGVVFLSRLD